MHIALITDGISPYVTGGMQRHSYHLARNFLAQGVKLTLVHAIEHDSEIPSEKEVKALLNAPKGMLRIIGLNFPKSMKVPGHYLRESYKYSQSVYESLKDEWANFDFIYAKGFSAWALIEKKKKGQHMAPVGVKFHGYEMFQKAPNLKSRIEQFMLRPPVVFNSRNANVVFSYGGEITEIIKKMGVPESRIVEIGSGVDNAWIVDKPKEEGEKRKFLFVGRAERRKGISELMHSVKVLDASQAEMHWVGPAFEKKKGTNSLNFFHGEISDSEALKVIFDQCQVLITPSHSEGMPNVILEAMARGLAVISTRVGAIPEMISDKNGRLIKPGSEKELRRAIKEMAALSKSELMELRKESLKVVSEKFSWNSVATQTLNAIRRITYSSKKQEVDSQIKP